MKHGIFKILYSTEQSKKDCYVVKLYNKIYLFQVMKKAGIICRQI